MTSLISRLALLATCAAAVCGAVAAPAGAAAVPTVTPATAITPGSALLHGSYQTGGVATSYSFEYDTIADWNAGGDNAGYTDTVFVPAGTATVNASALAGCWPAPTCALGGQPLQPGAKYEFILYVSYGTGGKYYQLFAPNSGQLTFTTPKLGKLVLTGAKLPVKKGKATITLKCSSTQPCQGTVAVTTRLKGKLVTCASGKVNLKAGKKGTLSDKVAGKCRKASAKSKSLSLKATLTTTLTTGQPDLKKKVVLQLA